MHVSLASMKADWLESMGFYIDPVLVSQGLAHTDQEWSVPTTTQGEAIYHTCFLPSAASRLSKTEPYAIAHLKLMKDNDTTIEDGQHELFVYKVLDLKIASFIIVCVCVCACVRACVRAVCLPLFDPCLSPTPVQRDGSRCLQVHLPPLHQ